MADAELFSLANLCARLWHLSTIDSGVVNVDFTGVEDTEF
jgi:hypothetical protein